MALIVQNRSYRKPQNNMPSGPFIDVEVTDDVNSKKVPALAFIDSGADITCISEEKIRELESTLGYTIMFQSVRVVDSKGNIIELQTYAIFVILEKKYAYSSDYGILPREPELFGDEELLIGRDILGGLVLTLDGPGQVFTIEDPKK